MNRTVPLRHLRNLRNLQCPRPHPRLAHTAAAAKDYYKLLGVSRNATAAEIKKAYYQLAKEHHPDTKSASTSTNDHFAQINTAYQTLSNPPKRRVYDVHGAAAVDAASDFSDAAHSQPSGQTIDDILREFGDFFTSQHPTPRRPPVDAPLPGDDVHVQASLTLQEAAFGTTKNLSIRSAEACSSCNATGKTSDTRIRKCPQCGGEGRVRRPGNEAGMMFHTVIMPCHRCEGAGKLMENACASCDGQGRLSAVREVAVAFPKGCDTGMVVRLPKGAGVGVRGGERGDLYVQVVMKEDDYFHRDGRHVHIVAPISVAQAALGGLVEVRTLDGKEQVKIRPGSQSDDSVTLYGRGLTSVRGGGIAGKRGNQIVHLKVVVPETVSGKQKELLEELLELEGGRMEKPEDCQMPALMRRFQRWLRRSVS